MTEREPSEPLDTNLLRTPIPRHLAAEVLGRPCDPQGAHALRLRGVSVSPLALRRDLPRPRRPRYGFCPRVLTARSKTLVALLVVLQAPLALAQPSGELPADARARTLLEQGLAAFGARDWERAVDSFQRGYAIEPRRVFLFSWAQADRLSGRCDLASPLYRRFLDERPPEEQAARAREGLARCAAPSAQPATVTVTRVVRVASPPRRTRPFWTDAVGDVLAGAGVVALVGSAVLFAAGEVAAHDAGDAGSLGAWRDASDRADAVRLWSGVAAGAGVVLVVAAVVRWATHERDEPLPPSPPRGLVLATWGD